jgi:DNA-directed RNA polymerase specialized sigma subunit
MESWNMKTTKEQDVLNVLKQQIKRIVWRLQYHTRTYQSRELLMLDDPNRSTSSISYQSSIIEYVDSNLFVYEVLELIPSPKNKYIFKRAILDGVPEKEIAKELKVSQQAVNKCKTKTLLFLKQKIPWS